MWTGTGPENEDEALRMLAAAAGFLADTDATQLPTPALAGRLHVMERADAVLTVARSRSLAAHDAKDGHLDDGQRTQRTWDVHVLRVTRGQACEYQAVRSLTRQHEPLLGGLRQHAVTKSVALRLAKWTLAIPEEYRAEAEQILVAAAQAGASLRALAEICAEIRSRTALPDPDGDDPALDRALFLDTTLDGAAVLRGDLIHC